MEAVILKTVSIGTIDYTSGIMKSRIENFYNIFDNYEARSRYPLGEWWFTELLRRNIIKPSEIIDAHTKVLNDKCDKYKCHYEDSCVSAIQLFNGNFTGDNYESAKKRFLYNASFSECFPNMIGNELTPEERAEWREFFKNTYGFDPEKD